MNKLLATIENYKRGDLSYLWALEVREWLHIFPRHQSWRRKHPFGHLNSALFIKYEFSFFLNLQLNTEILNLQLNMKNISIHPSLYVLCHLLTFLLFPLLPPSLRDHYNPECFLSLVLPMFLFLLLFFLLSLNTRVCIYSHIEMIFYFISFTSFSYSLLLSAFWSCL